jgi:sec-independent protein translocase protein TatA
MVVMFPLFGLPGGMEMLVILMIVVLLFGANKLPALARSSGQAMGEFKRGREDVERELREATSTTPASSRSPSGSASTDADAEPATTAE